MYPRYTMYRDGTHNARSRHHTVSVPHIASTPSLILDKSISALFQTNYHRGCRHVDIKCASPTLKIIRW